LRERLGRYLFMGAGDTESAQQAFQEAIDLLPEDEPRPELARALASFGAILMLRGRTRESVERCEHAIGVARKTETGTAEAHALNSQGVNLAALGDRSTGARYLRQSLLMCEELADPYGLFRAYLNLSDVVDMDGRVEEAADLALEGAARARELGMISRALALEGRAAARLFKLGRIDEADRLTERAAELPRSLAKLHHCAARAQLEVHRARAPEAEALIRAAEEATPSVSWENWIEPLASARVELEVLRGGPEQARRFGERALTLAAEHEQPFYTARLYAVTARAGALIAERARAAGDQAAAARASHRAQRLADRIARLLEPDRWRDAPPPEAVAYRQLCAAEARRAGGNATAADWVAVAKSWADLGLPLEEAYARLRQAECLALDGQRRLAAEAVAAGLGIAREAGASWLQGELESLAQRARLAPSDGASVVTGAQVERLGLTDRELDVLKLVAVGKTNREIGEQLFMAPKTASVHVSRILAKLDVSSRVEAATAAERLGIVE
jgi:ATP/maltotriose-dependent transcriptional regulator MalT